MSVVVHVTTELSGGAGEFAKNVHLAMLGLGMPSLMMTRERSTLPGTVCLKPMTRVTASLRARWLTLRGALGLVDPSYAIFGAEKSPVGASDIQGALKGKMPTAFVFYWISYFVDFDAIHGLKQAFPKVPIVFVCLDEALLTGACHYSHDCIGYQAACANCPATSMRSLKQKIESGFQRRQTLMGVIDPIVFYPTTNMRRMGGTSAVMARARSAVVPLGAIFQRELEDLSNSGQVRERHASATDKGGKTTLLIRSSSEYRKGCDLFVAALKGMSETMPDLRARLTVISIGDNTLSQAGTDQYVDHIDKGYVKREALIELYRDLDVLVVTSREDAGPLMINECVALGVFVITTPIGVASDLIVDGQNGLLAKDISHEAIGAALMRFLQDRDTLLQAAKAKMGPLQGRRLSLTFEGYVQAMMKQIQSSP